MRRNGWKSVFTWRQGNANLIAKAFEEPLKRWPTADGIGLSSILTPKPSDKLVVFLAPLYHGESVQLTRDERRKSVRGLLISELNIGELCSITSRCSTSQGLSGCSRQRAESPSEEARRSRCLLRSSPLRRLLLLFKLALALEPCLISRWTITQPSICCSCQAEWSTRKSRPESHRVDQANQHLKRWLGSREEMLKV